LCLVIPYSLDGILSTKEVIQRFVYALANGKAIEVGDWTYDLRHTVDRKTVYTPVGQKAVEAEARRVRLENTKAVVAQAAKNPDVEVIEKPDRASLKDTAASYIKDAERRKANEAAEQARLVTAEFIDLMRKRKKLYVDQIDRDDIFLFHEALRGRKCAERTVSNKHARLASWLRFAGIDKAILPPVPRYEEKLPTVYSSEQTRALLAAVDRLAEYRREQEGAKRQEATRLAFAAA
jgi:hypothetical protein